MKRPSNLVAYLAQLCGTGLDSRIIMPDVLATLQQLIPSAGAACFWFDAAGRPADFHAASLDLAQRCALAAGVRHLPAGPLALRRAGAVTVDWLAPAGCQGDLARFLLTPGQFAHWLDAWVTLPDAGGAPVRLLLLLLRRAHERSFSARDKGRLAELAEHLRQAPRWPAGRESRAWDGRHGEALDGTVILRDGALHWMDRAADDLLQRRLRIAPGGAWPDMSPLAAACVALAHRLESTDLSETTAKRGIALPGGTCVLRASRLTSCAGARSRVVAVALRWAEAWALAVLRQLRDTPLSPVQREIACRLALGQARGDICAALDIGGETMKTHLRQIRSRVPGGAGLGASAIEPGRLE